MHTTDYFKHQCYKFMQPPSKDTRVIFRISSNEAAQLRQVAAAANTTVSGYIRAAVLPPPPQGKQ